MNRAVRSMSNPGVKDTVRLRSRRARRETGLFIVEGFREIRRALDARLAIETLWFCPELYLGSSEADVVERAPSAGAQTIEVGAEPFRKMAYRDRPEGLLAVCRQFDTSLSRLSVGAAPLVLVVESIEKPGNLGTMIRAAAAAAADAVVVCDPTTDVFNPNVVRASLGTMFAMPLAVAPTTEVTTWLAEKGVALCAATPGGDVDLWNAPLSGAVAVAVGAEQFGLSEALLSAAAVRVRIPMPGAGAIDSLNAAASAAILLFEAVRQRVAPGP